MIDLFWNKDRNGYELEWHVEIQAPEKRKVTDRRNRTREKLIDVIRPKRFPFKTDLKKIPKSTGAVLMIVSKTPEAKRGKSLVEYNPPQTGRPLYSQIADSNPSPKRAIEFVNRWGLPDRYAGRFGQDEMNFATYRNLANRMDRAMQFFQNGNWRDMPRLDAVDYFSAGGEGISANMDVELIHDKKSGKWSVSERPSSLAAMMWIQLLRHAAADAIFKHCEYCDGWFVVGEAVGVRSDRKTCSDACRNKLNNQLRRNKQYPDLPSFT